jgi:hypothetical protein
MDFREIATRLTGFSTPVFGVSWCPPEAEVATARRVLAFLEDRRVLFNPYQLEVADQCVQSVVDIRRFLTTEIGHLPEDSQLGEHLRGIRAACRRFLDETPTESRRVRHSWIGPFESDFFLALGELRSTIGIHIAAVAAMHGLAVEGQLAETLPSTDDEP